MTSTAREQRPRLATAAVVGAAIAAVVVAATAFLRSFTALSDLAMHFGVPADQAWTFPVGIDGIVVVATVAAAMRRRARWYSWFLLVVGTILSVAFNGIHAWMLTASGVGVGIAVIPPLVTLAAIHLAVVLAREHLAVVDAPSTTTDNEPTAAPAGTVAQEPIDLQIPADWFDQTAEQAPHGPVSAVMPAPVTDQATDVHGEMSVVIDADVDPEGAREWALRQLRSGELNYVQIAEKVNRTEGTIRRWRDAAGIPPRMLAAA